MRILYVDCDSLRPDHLGCYGYHRNTSPNIDRIAEKGKRFTNYYASDVPCLPSRTGLQSGQFGIHTGVVNHGGLNADPRPEGTDRGFNTAGEYRTLAAMLSEDGHRTALISSFPTRHGAWHFLDGYEEWFDPGGRGNEVAATVAERAVPWIEDNAGADDWFLHVNFWDPHTPYNVPQSYGNPFAEAAPPEWPDEETIRDHYESYGPHSAQDVHHSYLYNNGAPDLARTPNEIDSCEAFERWIDGYDTGIRYLDDHVGRLLDALDRAGVREDTLVIISADHGENQGELNVYGDHQVADEKTCCVPLIVSGPGVKQGVDEGLHYQIDLGATLADTVGADHSPGWDSQSFAASITKGNDAGDEGDRDNADTGRPFLVLSQGAWACQRAVRWDDWLLIRTYHDGLKSFQPTMLFDLANDPHETTNLVDERPAVVAEGYSLYEKWHARRMRETATNEAGGNPNTPNALIDPLWQVVEEGGPIHTRHELESYADRLRETGREHHAEKLLNGSSLAHR